METIGDITKYIKERLVQLDNYSGCGNSSEADEQHGKSEALKDLLLWIAQNPIEYIHGNNPSIPDNELMSVAIEGDDIVIHLPIDLLVWSQAQREESITVIDKQKMAEHIVKHILEFGGDAEIGSTAFEDLIDNYFMNALESAEDWLKGWWEDETNED